MLLDFNFNDLQKSDNKTGDLGRKSSKDFHVLHIRDSSKASLQLPYFTFQLDTISHTLLTSLGNSGPNKQSEDRMLDANIACRKMAIEHPLLILRFISLK